MLEEIKEDKEKKKENIWNFKLGALNLESILTPWYITGITDGEGSFQITIQNVKKKREISFKPRLEFKITQKNYSLGMLYEIKKYFKCGRIHIDNSKTGTMKYVITNINDLTNKVIPHFDKYNLKTSKFLNYKDFKKAVLLMNEKNHLKKDGIDKLRNIKSYMNKARSFKDKFNYCWSKTINIESEWLQGFVDGEGSFQCEIGFTKRMKLNSYVNFSLQIQQSKHDVAILYAIQRFFQSGYLKPKYNIKDINTTKLISRNVTALWIRNVELICNFFDLYPIYTVKRLDYLDWKRLIELKKINAHKTREGLLLMRKIKSGMNNNRYK